MDACSYMNAYESYKHPINIKAEAMYTLQECRDRGLRHGTKFLSELIVTLKDVPPFFDIENCDDESARFEFEPTFTNLEDYLIYCKARAYFDLEDYPSCAYISKYSNNSKSMFLHYMSRYLAMHNEFIYDRTNIFDTFKPTNMQKFTELLDELLILNVYGSEDDSEEESDNELQEPQETFELDSTDQNLSVQQQEDDSTPKGRRCGRRPRNQRLEKVSPTTEEKKNNVDIKRDNTTKTVNPVMAPQSETNTSTSKEPRIQREDPYLLWLTAVMLKRLERCDEAVELLVRALKLQPCHWGAWIELATLIKDLEMLDSLNPRLMENNEYHWMHYLFIAHVLISFQVINGAVKIYKDILSYGHSDFQKWPYIQCQLAVAYHNKRSKNEIENAMQAFSTVAKLDPNRIDNFDLLSNLLYVCDNREELYTLSKHVASIDCYRQETLCILGNFYSIKSDHYKSVLYFKNALKMNPFNEIAWTLLGHEYIEFKNSSAAITAYRQALKINARDYRAWFGLGQIYELVKLPNYALFYFIKARKLKPNDFRMVLSLAEIFDRTDHLFEALTCFYKALHYDVEGNVLLKLGKYYEKYGDISNRVTYFNTLNKKALKTAMKDKNDEEIYLILCKIYLYLGHHYLDMRCYEKATTFTNKCRGLYKEMDKSASYFEEVQEHVKVLTNEIEARTESVSGSAATSSAIKARRYLFTL